MSNYKTPEALSQIDAIAFVDFALQYSESDNGIFIEDISQKELEELAEKWYNYMELGDFGHVDQHLKEGKRIFDVLESKRK